MIDVTKVRVVQRIGFNKQVNYTLATVLQVLGSMPRFANGQDVLEQRLRSGERIHSVPGVSYQVVEEDQTR